MNRCALAFKIYWRRIAGKAHWHAFAKDKAKGDYESLCGRHRLPKAYGQEVRRPPAFARCATCDIEEMHARGADESLPETTQRRSERLRRCH